MVPAISNTSTAGSWMFVGTGVTSGVGRSNIWFTLPLALLANPEPLRAAAATLQRGMKTGNTTVCGRGVSLGWDPGARPERLGREAGSRKIAPAIYA
jgi:hypothetical protein